MVKNYQQNTIETLAQNALKYYDEALITGEPKEIPIEELIEFHFGYIIQYRTLTKNGTIHGVAVFEDSLVPVYDTSRKRYEAIVAKEGTILIENRLLAKNMEKRLRFTLAHELSHFMIHTDYYKEINELASKTSTDSTVKTEREADALAAALLMPKGRVKVAFSRLKHQLKMEAVLYQLAGLFNVSIQAMEIRISKLGLR